MYLPKCAGTHVCPCTFRFQSPKTGRFTGEGFSNSLGAEGSSPFSYLKRPKEMRKGVSSVPETCFPVRREGFETAAPAGQGTQPFNTPQLPGHSEPGELRREPSSTASPSKVPGLLSRTFSSGNNNEAVKVIRPLCPRKRQLITSNTVLGCDLAVSFSARCQAKVVYTRRSRVCNLSKYCRKNWSIAWKARAV